MHCLLSNSACYTQKHYQLKGDLNPKSFLVKYTITQSTVVTVYSFIRLFTSTKSDVPFYVKKLTAMRLRLSPKCIQRQLPLSPRPHSDHSPLLSTVWSALSALFHAPSTRTPTYALQDYVCSSCSIEQISLKISMSWQPLKPDDNIGLCIINRGRSVGVYNDVFNSLCYKIINNNNNNNNNPRKAGISYEQ